MQAIVFVAAFLVLPSAVDPQLSHCDFFRSHPRRHAAYYVQDSSKITVDGILDEQVWAEVPWSEIFQDIQGPQFWSQPWFSTKFKLRYDRQFLYVGAYLEETAVWANVTKRNEVVFHDNDFEVFVDADGTTHNYKEFEINALNTTWNLLLNRPYRDGGHENSTRVDPEHGFDMLSGGMKSAVYFQGMLGDPAERLHYWTVEIALPLSQLALHTKAKVPPAENSFWRINFSRVEWSVRVSLDSRTGKQYYEKKPGLKEENWVWSAQYQVAMHRPEWWGYLQFRPRAEKPPQLVYSAGIVPLDPEWGVRYVSFQFYYAQHAYHSATGAFALTLHELLPFFSSHEAFRCAVLVDVDATKDEFRARIKLTEQESEPATFVATIHEDSFITVEKMQHLSATKTVE